MNFLKSICLYRRSKKLCSLSTDWWTEYIVNFVKYFSDQVYLSTARVVYDSPDSELLAVLVSIAPSSKVNASFWAARETALTKGVTWFMRSGRWGSQPTANPLGSATGASTACNWPFLNSDKEQLAMTWLTCSRGKWNPKTSVQSFPTNGRPAAKLGIQS